MSHYFINDESLSHNERVINYEIGGVKFTLTTDSGVFSKSELDEGTRLLIETLAPLPLGKRLLDLGCGYGPIGLSLAKLNPSLDEIICSDVNTRALALCERNADTLALSHRVTCLQSDIYVEIEGQFDSIVSNPPIRAGKKVTYAIYIGAKDHLIDGGSLYIVIRKQQGAPSVMKFLEQEFGNVEVLARKKGFYVLKAVKQ